MQGPGFFFLVIPAREGLWPETKFLANNWINWCYAVKTVFGKIMIDPIKISLIFSWTVNSERWAESRSAHRSPLTAHDVQMVTICFLVCYFHKVYKCVTSVNKRVLHDWTQPGSLPTFSLTLSRFQCEALAISSHWVSVHCEIDCFTS